LYSKEKQNRTINKNNFIQLFIFFSVGLEISSSETTQSFKVVPHTHHTRDQRRPIREISHSSQS